MLLALVNTGGVHRVAHKAVHVDAHAVVLPRWPRRRAGALLHASAQRVGKHRLGHRLPRPRTASCRELRARRLLDANQVGLHVRRTRARADVARLLGRRRQPVFVPLVGHVEHLGVPRDEREAAERAAGGGVLVEKGARGRLGPVVDEAEEGLELLRFGLSERDALARTQLRKCLEHAHLAVLALEPQPLERHALHFLDRRVTLALYRRLLVGHKLLEPP
mmetsp:Transcript_45427/g.146218  ORF Transcript_45427/g.146218 Transcript_45427/m.146218 type:complete len:220 (-) Transcript_45427:457-1116(-)